MTPRHEIPGRRLTSADMRARFNIAPRTLNNWRNDPEVGLPPAIVIKGRPYWPIESIEAWEASRTMMTVARAA